MTNNGKSWKSELSEAVAVARLEHGELIDAACAWQGGRAEPIDPDLFALVCAVAQDGWNPETTPTRWTRIGVGQLISSDVRDWCTRQRCMWPLDLVHVMWVWLDFLRDTGRLDPASDPVAELRKPLICWGQLDQHGNELPAGAPPALPCECLLPYRETAELLGELVRQSGRTGSDPLDPLRRAVGRPLRRRSGWDALLRADDDPDFHGEPWWADPDDRIY